MQEASSVCYLHNAGFLLGLFFDPEDVLPKRRLILNELHGVVSQKLKLLNNKYILNDT
jgi:hypothetical protein